MAAGEALGLKSPQLKRIKWLIFWGTEQSPVRFPLTSRNSQTRQQNEWDGAGRWRDRFQLLISRVTGHVMLCIVVRGS